MKASLLGLLSTAFLLASPVAEAGQGATRESVLELLQNDGRFSTLSGALTAADLGDLLDGDGPFTIFAPTDAAFADLPEGMAVSLLRQDNIEGLRALLGYHVDDRKLSRHMLPDQPILVQPVNMDTRLCVARTPDGISISDGSGASAEAEGRAIRGANGIIYAIDKVLIPGPRPACG
ncbi:fasciclin domain-containing protein [Jannaschia pohangensis]|uniref:Uncaracterized surface protein containing fasciclin (FAS1) repeats n=1 Tax=Jannaschia pohangensis TaxID=390807 RepID=A0A1I3S1W9_9RHOB|nr:fasciclin domain-containing protein [Jannaschia pohangensis]SFJ52824.1 Uncaracterized surface protein containing fasciclin (FAS1) repeats [Jannaschia pohangensis]